MDTAGGMVVVVGWTMGQCSVEVPRRPITVCLCLHCCLGWVSFARLRRALRRQLRMGREGLERECRSGLWYGTDGRDGNLPDWVIRQPSFPEIFVRVRG